MERVYIGIIVIFFVFIATLIALMLKYKKEGKILKEEKIKNVLMDLAYFAVCQAEVKYKDGHGKEKLQCAIEQMKKDMPHWLSWAVSEDLIVNCIEIALQKLQSVLKAKKGDKLLLLDEIIEMGYESKNLETTLSFATNKKEEIKNGYVEGYAEGHTDFHGNNSATAGVKAGIKF